jgi:hypothetical protein
MGVVAEQLRLLDVCRAWNQYEERICKFRRDTLMWVMGAKCPLRGTELDAGVVQNN